MKAHELRDMDVESLRAKTQEIDDQLFRMRIQKSMGQLEAPGKMRTRAHRLRLLSGRDSAITTVSPILASFFSSCATNVDVRFCVLP